MAIHFLSDLHLSGSTPDLNQLFLHTLANWQGQIDALYILGDLFEYWVGDDDDTPELTGLLKAMQRFAEKTPLFVMRGNRDFLMGTGFEARSGARLIVEPTLITVFNRPYLLCHGDALCTADEAYQQFRAVSRGAAWQEAILARPLSERHALARHARQLSQENKAIQGLSGISDVTYAAVQQLLDQYDWPTLIHGHTHRPAQHYHSHDKRHAIRWVIADWHDSYGGYLALDANGISAHVLG